MFLKPTTNYSLVEIPKQKSIQVNAIGYDVKL